MAMVTILRGGDSLLAAIVTEIVLTAGFLLVIHGVTDKRASTESVRKRYSRRHRSTCRAGNTADSMVPTRRLLYNRFRD